MKRTTIFLAEADRNAIQTIKDRYGISSDSDAIRLALRVIAGVQNPQILLLPLPESSHDSRERTVEKVLQAG